MRTASTNTLSLEPLEKAITFGSSDVEETHAYAANLISDHRLIVSGTGFGAKIKHTNCPGAQFIQMRFGATVRVEPDAIHDYFLLHVPLSGHSRLNHPNGDLYLSNSKAGITSADVPFEITWAPNCSKLIVLIAKEKVSRICFNVLGDEFRPPLLFEPKVDLLASSGSALLNLLSYGLSLNTLDRASKVFTGSCYEETLITHLLSFQPHNYSNSIKRETGSVLSPYYVKQAESFIEENLAQPITLTDIAEYCGVTTRTLTRGFRSYRNKTPISFLKERRLEKVRLDLQSGAVRSVAETAYSWGFTHLGRFARLYQEQFGERPNETTKRSQVLRRI